MIQRSLKDSVCYQYVDRREQKEQFTCTVNFLAQQKEREFLLTAHAPDSSALYCCSFID